MERNKSLNCLELFIARFVCGLANGAIRCLIPIYIYDIVSDVQRKRMDFLQQAQFAFGVLIVFISGNEHKKIATATRRKLLDR